MYQRISTSLPMIFISARVHPGEIPASHLLNGFLDGIFEEKYLQILENFIIFIVPMINPDGVYRGHWRTDTLGQNLNRFYQNPTQEHQPSIYAIDQLVNCHQNNLKFYIDMHAHSGKYGCFIFGNALNFQNQIESQLFVRLISLNSKDFDYQQCNFTEKNMYQADKSDGLSKEGSGRVAFGKKYKIQHCYTIECNYTKGINRYSIPDLSQKREQFNYTPKDFKAWYFGIKDKKIPKEDLKLYNNETFEDVGKGIVQSILDITNKSESTRLINSNYKCLDFLRYYIAIILIQTAPFRFEHPLRSLIKGLHEKQDMFIGAFQQLRLILDKNKSKPKKSI